MSLPDEIWQLIIELIEFPYDSKRIDRILAYHSLLKQVNKQFDRICNKLAQKINPQNIKFNYDSAMNYFIEQNWQSCFIFAHQARGFKLQDPNNFFLFRAVRLGQLEIIKYIIDNGCSFDVRTLKKMTFPCRFVYCLKYFHEQLGITFDAADLEQAMKGSSIDCIEYLWSIGVRPAWSELPEWTIHFLDSNPIYDKVVRPTGLYDNDKKCFEFLRKQGYNMSEKAIETKIKSQSVEALDRLFEMELIKPSLNITSICAVTSKDHLKHIRSLGFPWDESTCLAICKSGSVEALAYAHEHGCKWNRQEYMDTIMKRILRIEMEESGMDAITDLTEVLTMMYYVFSHTDEYDPNIQHIEEDQWTNFHSYLKAKLAEEDIQLEGSQKLRVAVILASPKSQARTTIEKIMA